MLEFGGIRGTLSLPSLLSSLWPREVALDRVKYVEVAALTCRINKNNNSGPSKHLVGRKKVEQAVTLYFWESIQMLLFSGPKEELAVTQYRTCNTWNVTEASRCIYTLICPLTGPATNHCPGNGLGHLKIVERPNVHIISLQLLIHYYAWEHWLIATEPYDRIPTK